MSAIRKASEGTPRPGDLPVAELKRRAEDMIQHGWTVHFKFTCAHCGERCTFDTPNTLYGNGECFKCGQSTAIDVGGFSLQKGNYRNGLD